MKDLGNYVCEGQMNIFDFIEDPNESKSSELQQDENENANLCADCIFRWLELPDDGFGCHYDTNKNICYRERMFKASEGWHLVNAKPPYTVPMDLPLNPKWEPIEVLLYNKQYDHYAIGSHYWLAKDKTFKSQMPEPFGEVVAWRYIKKVKVENDA